MILDPKTLPGFSVPNLDALCYTHGFSQGRHALQGRKKGKKKPKKRLYNGSHLTNMPFPPMLNRIFFGLLARKWFDPGTDRGTFATAAPATPFINIKGKLTTPNGFQLFIWAVWPNVLARIRQSQAAGTSPHWQGSFIEYPLGFSAVPAPTINSMIVYSDATYLLDLTWQNVPLPNEANIYITNPYSRNWWRTSNALLVNSITLPQTAPPAIQVDPTHIRFAFPRANFFGNLRNVFGNGPKPLIATLPTGYPIGMGVRIWDPQPIGYSGNPKFLFGTVSP